MAAEGEPSERIELHNVLNKMFQKPVWILCTTLVIAASVLLVVVTTKFNWANSSQQSALEAIEEANGTWRDTEEGITIDLRRVNSQVFPLKHLRSINNICSLDISKTNYGANDIEEIGDQPHLKGLIADGNSRFFELGGISTVAPNLTILDIPFSAINDKGLTGLEQFQSLRRLNLAYTKISDSSAESIVKVESIQELDVTGTQVSDRFVETLGSGLHGLRSFQGASTAVTPDCLKFFARFNELRNLNLSRTSVGGYGLKQLSGLKLYKLDLSFCKVQNSDVELISRIKSLRSISLAGCDISKECLVYLEKLDDLVELNVTDTTIVPEDFESTSFAIRMFSIRCTPREERRR